MKKSLFYIPLIGLFFTLTACPFSFEDDDWIEEFGTPELLLNNASENAYVYLYEEGERFLDSDDLIKNALIDAAPYMSIEKREASSERYFTYEAKWLPATSGPNYEHLIIYDDGFVVVHHKASLGPHKYRYFSISEAKAKLLNDLVFSYVEDN